MTPTGAPVTNSMGEAMKKRTRKQTPIALLWTRRDQLRFTQAVERFCGAVNDLERLIMAMNLLVDKEHFGFRDNGQGATMRPGGSTT